jgi:hypothetical protein
VNPSFLPPSLLPPSLRHGAPPWPVSLVQSAADREEHRRPKLTAALRSSSRSLPLLLEAIHVVDHTNEFAEPRWIPLRPRRCPKIIGSPPSSTTELPSPEIAHRRSNPRWDPLPFLLTVGSRSNDPDRSLIRTGIGRSGASKSHKIQRSPSLIRTNWYPPTRLRHVSSPGLS